MLILRKIFARVRVRSRVGIQTIKTFFRNQLSNWADSVFQTIVGVEDDDYYN